MSESTIRKSQINRPRQGRVPETIYRPRPAQSRDYPRAIPQAATFGGADAMRQTANFFSSFLGPMDSALREWAASERAEWDANRKEENQRLGMEALRIAYDDPAGVAEAMRGGPQALAAMSTLPGIDPLRPEFIETLKMAHGENMALIDFQEKFLPQLAKLNFLTDNPRTLRDRFADEQMKGADQAFDYAYRAKFNALSDKQIQTWFADQRGFVMARQVETEITSMKASAVAGEPMSLEDIQEGVGKVVALAETAEGKLAARDRYLFEVFRVAQETGDGSLLLALSRPDPETGLSVADIHRDIWEKALEASQRTHVREKSLDATRHLTDINIALASLAAGNPASVDTPEGVILQDGNYILSQLHKHRNTFGYSKAWETQLEQAIGVLGKQIKVEAQYDRFNAAINSITTSPGAGIGYVPQEDLDKYGAEWVNKFIEDSVASGKSVTETMGIVARAAAAYGGFGKDWNRATEHRFMNGSLEQQAETLQFLQMVEESGGLPGSANNILSDPTARAKFDFLNVSVKLGDNPLQILEGFQKSAEITGTVDWRRYGHSVIDAKTMKSWTDDVLSEVSSELSARPTSIITERVTEEIARQLWLTAGTLRSPADRKDAIVKAVAQTISSNTEVVYDNVSESLTLAPRTTPEVVMLEDGSVTRQEPVTKATQQQAVEAFEEDITEHLPEVFGTAVGIVPGPETRMGYGAVVIVENEAGIQGPAVFEWGELEADLTQALPTELPEGIVRTETGFSISNTGKPIRFGRFIIAQHPTLPGHAGLYYVGEQKTQAEIEQETKERLTKLAEQLNVQKETKPTGSIITQGTQGVSEAIIQWLMDKPIFERTTETDISFPKVKVSEPVVTVPVPDVEPEAPAEPEAKVSEPVVTVPIAEEITAPELAVSPATTVPATPEIVETPVETTEVPSPVIPFVGMAAEEPSFIQKLYDTGKAMVEKQVQAVKERTEKISKAGRAWVAAPSVKHAETRRTGIGNLNLTNYWQKRFQSWLSSASEQGLIGGDTAAIAAKNAPKNETEFMAFMSQTYKESLNRGDEWTGHSDQKYIQQASDLIYKEEGFSARSYKDANTRSIGYGCNLKRKDFRRILEKQGYDFDLVWKGKQKITKETANMLREYEVVRLSELIKQQAAGTSLETHQVLALVSYAYNLGEGALKPVMRMIRQGNLIGAATYIKDKVPPYSLPARTREVLKKRRQREALMFLGYNAPESITFKQLYNLE